MADPTLPILDPVRLQRESMGSEALQVEKLSLFVAEVERLLRQVDIARDEQTRESRLLAIAGAARNVGALRLAQVARTAAVEAITSADPIDLAPVSHAVDEVIAYIRRAGV